MSFNTSGWTAKLNLVIAGICLGIGWQMSDNVARFVVKVASSALGMVR